MKRVRLVDPPPEDWIEEVAEVFARSSVGILPTDTVYGYHAVPWDDEAVERIYRMKGRDGRQPLLVLCGSLADLDRLGIGADARTLEALDRIWPAPLTAILPISRPLPVSGGGLSLGVRIPALEWLRNLLQRTGPLASTSLNRRAEPPSLFLPDDGDPLLSEADLVVDAGRLEGQPSTVVDFTKSSPEVLREGAFEFTQKLWKKLWNSL